MGFSMKASTDEGETKVKKKKHDGPAVPIEWAESDEMYQDRFALISKPTVSYFRGIEGRAAATPQRPQKKEEKASFELQVIEKDFALFVIKWCPGGSLDEKGAEFAPGGEDRNW